MATTWLAMGFPMVFTVVPSLICVREGVNEKYSKELRREGSKKGMKQSIISNDEKKNRGKMGNRRRKEEG